MKISIAMATYNGAKYIQEQIESLANQTHLPFELVICDDGSTDETISIIDELSSQLPFGVRLYHNEENLHFTGNFLKAASLCTGDIIAFCDQDDIWDKRKIEVCAAALDADQSDLAIHEGRVIDSAGRPISRKIPNLSGNLEEINVAPFSRISKGFAMVMRREVIDGVMACWDWNDYITFRRKYGFLLGHDLFIYAWCTSRKQITYIQEELVQYRVHGENVTARAEITKNRLPRFMAFLRGLTTVQSHYYLPGKKWSAEAVFLRSYLCRAAGAQYPGLEQLTEWLTRKSKLWIDRATIYDRQSTRSARWRKLICILFSGGYLSYNNPGLGFRSLAKDMVVASIY